MKANPASLLAFFVTFLIPPSQFIFMGIAQGDWNGRRERGENKSTAHRLAEGILPDRLDERATILLPAGGYVPEKFPFF
jgi:hypothetical protein